MQEKQVLERIDLIYKEKIIQNILNSFKDKTIILITHDVKLLKKFDEILVFKSGEILIKGNYEYLNKESEYFKQLHDYNEKKQL